jgi:GT2 family glycosyltransferase
MTPVDVLTVNFRTPELVEQAVAAVAGPGTRVLVYDNSGDLAPDEHRPTEVYGDGTNRLFAAANNALFAVSDAALVLLLNPDVVLAHRDLARLVRALEERPEAWGAAPALLNPDGSLQNYARRLPTLGALLADRCPPLRWFLRRQLDWYYCRDKDLSVSGVVDQPAAACLLLRRERVAGSLFDPSYPLFFNDTDLARRLNGSGPCLYVAAVQAVHQAGASIERARSEHRSWVRRQYDDSLLRYARANLRGWQVLVPIVLARRVVARHPQPPTATAPVVW